jgi:hypothetical protein
MHEARRDRFSPFGRRRARPSAVNENALLLTPIAAARLRVASLAAALLGIVLIYLVNPNFHGEIGPRSAPYGGDFLQEWVGGRMVRSGEADRLYDLQYVVAAQHDARDVGYAWDDARYLPMVYPPFYYLLVSPLSYLPSHVAAIVWAALLVGALAATVAMLASAYPALRERFAPAIPLAVLFAPMIENLASSQKGTILLFILTASFLLQRSGRPWAAGCVFGLMAIKPHLAVLIGISMLLRRQWRFTAGAATTAAVLLGVSLAVSPSACADYLRLSSGVVDYVYTSGYDLAKSHCWYGFFTLLAADSPSVARSLTGIAAAGTIYLLARLLSGPLRPKEPKFALQYSGMILATVLLSPHLMTYDLTLLLLPLFLFATQIAEGHDSASSLARPGDKTGDKQLCTGTHRRRLMAISIGLYALGGASTAIARSTGVQISVLLMAATLAATAAARSSKKPDDTNRRRFGVARD